MDNEQLSKVRARKLGKYKEALGILSSKLIESGVNPENDAYFNDIANNPTAALSFLAYTKQQEELSKIGK